MEILTKKKNTKAFIILSAGFSEENKEGEVKNTIFNGFFINVDLAIVNVPLVPEFGVVVGMLTIFGAMGIFLFVRKN